MTKQRERFAILDAVTRELGGTVTKRAETELGDYEPMAWQNITLEGFGVDTNPLHSISLSLHYNGARPWKDRKGDYIHVSGDWPRDRKGNMVHGRDAEYGTPNPSINVSAAKTPVQAARDIRRRFLPEYARLYAKAMAIVDSRNQYEADVAANYHALAAACGGSVSKSQWQDAWIVKGLPDGITVTYVGDDNIRLELNCTPAEAAQLISDRAKVPA